MSFLQAKWKLSLTCCKLLVPYFRRVSPAWQLVRLALGQRIARAEPRWPLKNSRALKQCLFKLTSVGVKCQPLTGEWCWLWFWTDNVHKSPSSAAAFVLRRRSPGSERGFPGASGARLACCSWHLSHAAQPRLLSRRCLPVYLFLSSASGLCKVWPEGPVFYTQINS